MNILFLLKGLDIGGVEIVTYTLANKLHQEGHSVVIWAFKNGRTNSTNIINNGITIIYGNGYKYSKRNVNLLRETLITHKIDIAINQWGLPIIPCYTLCLAAKGLKIRILSVYHNDPSTNGRLKEVETSIAKHRNTFLRSALKIKYYIYRFITSASMRYIYQKSDKFIVLSDSHVEKFKRFTNIRNTSKLTVITNPVTIDTANFTFGASDKKKEIVYIGRLDSNQKRVHRVLETWALIEKNHSDWVLRIIGDGDERKKLERLIEYHSLKNVSLEGVKYPRPYYEKASVLLLTSEYEGFGLVIVEGMSFGVVPIVLGSYSAVHDIIDDGKDGFIIPYCKHKGFVAKDMANKLEFLMNNEDKRKEMALAAIEKSKKFSVDEIYKRWLEIMGK